MIFVVPRHVQPSAFQSSVRFIGRFPLKSDINITAAGKTKIAVGQGGRSSRTGYTATVFGSTGFLGRLLVSKLAKHGTITVSPYRNETAKKQLKVNGDLGVVNFVELDLRNLESIRNSVAHSDIVFNLIGTEQSTKNFSIEDVNIEGARRIAQISKEAGVARFIHVSSYNADPASSSDFYASKGVGEQVVREIYPDATIVRPSPMYARNSPFLNQLLARRTFGDNILFKNQVFPTHGIQVAAALEKIGFDDSTRGQTYELHGTEEYSKREIREMIKEATHLGQNAWVPAAVGFYLPAPEIVVKAFALLRQYISSQPRVSLDSVNRVNTRQVFDPNAKTFADLGMVPDEFADLFYTYIKPHITASSQVKNRTVYAREDVERLRDYVNTPSDSFNLFNLK
ncbi:unnamed protein product [Kuraishia capsulata CBS 1993]|uniref:NAD-dependent epimerase/dehydratase domain-containing protein n=1 Tax=Kuraishia capsulata CBS 1993 TaxID=1382522 RepID=W6MV49_9ASCO|nr:uncharacterized protein KUCA_T00005760001 [Kuraishia capsulata CBS 1993]CDK29767.1 unnamed protein product [Kuraishia capsulata CBS 1993]